MASLYESIMGKKAPPLDDLMARALYETCDTCFNEDIPMSEPPCDQCSWADGITDPHHQWRPKDPDEPYRLEEV